ncbi:MAG: phosphatase PAP2 family protein [Clostridiales bacterium]|nr:phosphatase PAP2 family protein [Clostridiales bacterium]
MALWFEQLEGQLLLLIQDLRCEPLSAVLVPLTRLGEYGAIWIACSLVMLCFRRTRRAGVAGLAALLIGQLVNDQLLKNLVCRARPFTQIQGLWTLVEAPTDYSFPSGHSCAAFAAAVAWWRTLDIRWLKLLLLIAAVLMALSRLYVGVHYPSDILGGAAVGSLIAVLVCRALEWLERRRRGTLPPEAA